MRRNLSTCLAVAFGLGFVLPPPFAAGQTPAPPPAAPAKRTAAELEKLAMPIALHPDPLVSIILPASVYPVEIVQAARFVKDTNNVAKVDQQPWDENVKAVARFPALVAKMDADLAWTVQLGQAFVDQPKELMDTIQSLRAKAQKAGTLKSTPQQVVTVTNVVIVETNAAQVVTVTNQVIQVQPSNPQVVYVPTYPTTVYYPPPGYVYDPYAPLVTFGVGIAIGAIIANNCDWHGGGIWVGGGGMVIWGGGGHYHGDVDIDIDHNVNIDRPDRPDRPTPSGSQTRPTQQKWQPDQNRMRNSGAQSAQARDARGWSGASQRPAGGGAAARPGQQPTAGAGSPRPGTQPSGAGGRPSASQQPSATRPSPAASPSVNRSGSQSSGAFSGVSSGGGARSFSSRGSTSRGGGGRGGGRR
jgi:hypothetical protein